MDISSTVADISGKQFVNLNAEIAMENIPDVTSVCSTQLMNPYWVYFPSILVDCSVSH